MSYLFTYLLPDRYPISYPVGYPGNELPDNGSPCCNHTAIVTVLNMKLLHFSPTVVVSSYISHSSEITGSFDCSQWKFQKVALEMLLLDPEGRSQKATLVAVLLVVGISSPRSRNP